MTEVEIKQIDLRYESFRMKNQERERKILNSISERGIREALIVFESSSNSFVLLDGFKRFRSAVKLKLFVVPVESLGKDEAQGLIQYLRKAQMRGLSFIEEASFVDILKKNNGLNISEIARQIERSPAWVSIRLGVLEEMSPLIKRAILEDKFPARSYLYTLRPFTRVKGKKKEVEKFVQCVSGKGFSIRHLEKLAIHYFQGGNLFKEQIHNGNIEWTLDQVNQNEDYECKKKSPFNSTEKKVLSELSHIQSLIQRIPCDLKDRRLKHVPFFVQAGVLITEILDKISSFIKNLKEFYDQRR